jgi:membrane protein DedA with SNARE-associated domain
MDLAPFAALSGLLLVKEIGVPIPVPGDLLILGAGAATSGRPEALVWLAGILAAGYVGGTIQFLLVRGAMRGPALALLARLGVPPVRLDDLATRLRTGGPIAVAVARATPGLRVAAIAASGVAGLPLRTFLPGFLIGNTIFVSAHFALGFAIGKPALAIAASLGTPAVIAAVLVVLSAAGAVAWFAIRQRRAAAMTVEPAGATPAEHVHTESEAGFGAWEDGSCPICLTLAAVRSRHQPAGT